MEAFLKWSAVVVAVGFGASLVYRTVQGVRSRLDRGLARIEAVADQAQQALDSTRQSIEQTQRTVHSVREGLG